MINWLAFGLQGLLGAATVSTTPPLSNALSVEGCEFGDIYATTPATCEIAFANSGDTPLHVKDFQVVSGSGTATPPELVIPPHATAQVRMQIDTSKSSGRNSYIVLFDSEPKATRRSTKVNGYVLSALDQSLPQIELGVVDLAKGKAARDYPLSSREVADFKIMKVVDAPSWLNVDVTQDGHALSVAVPSDAVWGLQEDYIRIALNTPRQKEALVKVKADLHGDVVPSANPLDIGVVHLGDRNEALVRLNSLSHKAFKVGRIKVDGFKATTKLLPCQPVAVDCKMIRLAVSKQQPTGSLKGIMSVELPDYKRTLPIATWGFLVPKDYKVRKFGEDAAQSPASAGATDMAGALEAATREKPVDPPPPAGDGPLLKWTVANAGTVYGFQIFRSESESGPFVLLNPIPVHADTENNDSQSFQWRDTDARHGVTYYYSIGILRINGKKEHLAGPQKIVAK